MNILLWILQVMLAWLSIAGGFFQIFKIEDLQRTVAAMRELPTSLWAVFGAIGILAGLGLILPGAINVQPGITPYAAAIMAVESIIIAGLYIYFGDKAPLPFVIVMAVLGAFIAYGRFVLKPF